MMELPVVLDSPVPLALQADKVARVALVALELL